MASCNLYRVEANDPFYRFLYEVDNAPPSNEAFVAPFSYEIKNQLGQRRCIYCLRMPDIIR